MMKQKIMRAALVAAGLIILNTSFAFGQTVTRLFDATSVALSDVASGLNQPYGIDVVGKEVYIADTYNNMIKKLSGGEITTLAGSYSGKNSMGFPMGGLVDGDALEASFNKPRDVIVTDDGIIYVADTGNNVIRKIESGHVSTISGNGSQGNGVGAPQYTSYHLPTALALDSNENLYVADTLNHVIKVISPSGNSTVLAFKSPEGSETITLNEPSDLWFDTKGDLYILDSGNQCVRKVSNGVITTVAGINSSARDANGYAVQGYRDTTASMALFNFPKGIAMDERGNLFIADTWNNMIRVVLVDGNVKTLSGDLYAGNVVGDIATARYDAPVALDVEGDDLYVSDRWNNEIKHIALNMSTDALKLSTDYLKKQMEGSKDYLDAETPIIYYHGVGSKSDATVLQLENRIYLPFKSFAFALGYEVTWNPQLHAVVLEKESQRLLVDESTSLMLVDGKSYLTPEALDHLFHVTVQYDAALKGIFVLD